MKFEDVLALEAEDIRARRSWVTTDKAAWIGKHPEFAPPPLNDAGAGGTAQKTEPLNVLGIGLSGGGIRSSAFCLGVLQALDVSLRKRTNDAAAPSPLLRADYLSTVSGGGYIGTSMTAAMSVTEGQFPFESKLDENETPSMQHVRNYSNYLFPRGPGDLLRNVVIILRGLSANIILVVPWLLLAAAITIFFNPSVDWLNKPVLLSSLRTSLGPTYFFFTVWLGIIGFTALLLWALWRSLPGKKAIPELPSYIVSGVGYLVVALLVVAFIEAQPLAIGQLVEDYYQRGGTRPALVTLVDQLITVLTPVAVVVVFVWQKLQTVIAAAEKSPTIRRKAMAWLSVIAIYVGAFALPIVMWAVYLKLSYWVIGQHVSNTGMTGWLVYLSKSAWLTWPAGAGTVVFNWLAAPPAPDVAMIFNSFKYASVYGFVWLAFFAIGWLLDPNANSLLRLYRDRLSKAFLFKVIPVLTAPDTPIPRLESLRENRGEGEAKTRNAAPTEDQPVVKEGVVAQVSRGLREILKPSSGLKISQLSQTFCPYHIINTALNLQGSKSANRRGRNADFFIFSRRAIGSDATSYAATAAFEKNGAPELTLDTAMAISGAAFNANMGSMTIKPLSPTLAFLNVRLGYWLRNPRYALEQSRLKILRKRFTNPYFMYEALGRLNERKWDVYVSDGGHLENLGIYQLLKRRCKVIIAVDAEADSSLNFSSFVTLQRYARIDLGVRIELPWQQIQRSARDIDTVCREKGGPVGKLDCRGPHCAIGTICYGDNVMGVLVYVKASLSGDENDYVADYKRRYQDFPHETTLDQFFSEEQFEVYRALGFHALDRMLDGTDDVAVYSKQSAEGRLRKFSEADPLLDDVRHALGFA